MDHLKQFEEAVLIVLSPPSVGSPGEDFHRFQAATSFIQHLAGRGDAPQLSLQLLYSTQHSPARFFALQALAQFIAGPMYGAPGGGQGRAELRGALLGYARARGGDLGGEEAYVRTKLALCLTLCLKRDYPEEWVGAVQDLAGLPQGLGQVGGEGGELAGYDLFLRVLQCFQEEIVDPRINRSPQELARNVLVKDALRQGGDTSIIASLWLAILTTHGNALLLSGGGTPAIATAAAAATTATTATLATTAGIGKLRASVLRACTTTMASFVDWVDIGLITQPAFVERYAALLALPVARAGICSVLYALIDKGMDASARCVLVRGLGLVAVAGSLTEGVERALGAPGAGDDPCPYGSTGTDDDSDFGGSVGALVCRLGRGLVEAGTSRELMATAVRLSRGEVSGGSSGNSPPSTGGSTSSGSNPSLGGGGRVVPLPPDTLPWLAQAIQATCDLALRLLACGAVDSSVALGVLPLLTDLVGCFMREGKGGGGQSSSSSSSSSRGGGECLVEGVSLASFEGRPAGQSVGFIMERLLGSIVALSSLDAEEEEEEGGGVGGGGGDVSGGGGFDDSSENDIRGELRKLFIAAVRAAPEAVLNFLSLPSPSLPFPPFALQTLAALPSLADASRPTWPQAEVVLSLLLAFCEGAPTAASLSELKAAKEEGCSPQQQPPAPSVAATHPLHLPAPLPPPTPPPTPGGPSLPKLLLAAIACGMGTATHRLHSTVSLAWFELLSKFSGAVFVATPQRTALLATVLQSFVGAAGIRSPLPRVRSRASFFLLKFIKGIVKGGAPDVLVPFMDNLLGALAQFLVPPFLHPEVVACMEREWAGRSSGGGGGGGGGGVGGGNRPPPLPPPEDGDKTLGASGLGSEDREKMFECASLLLGSGCVTPDRRAYYAGALLSPLLTTVEGGLDRLAQLGCSGGGGGLFSAAVSGTTAGGGVGAGVGVGGGVRGSSPLTLPTSTSLPSSSSPTPTTPTPPPTHTWEEHVAVWVVRVLSALGYSTKGFGNISKEPTVAVLAERALQCSLRAVSILPSHARVRERCLFVLHRMVDCLDTLILPHLHTLFPLLLNLSHSPTDVTSLLTLVNQVTIKFKGACVPILTPLLHPLLQCFFRVIPHTTHAGGGATTSPTPSTTSPTPTATALSSSHPPPVTLLSEEEREARRAGIEMQRIYVLFFSSLAAHDLATPVLASPPNAPHFIPVLTTVMDIASKCNDAAVARTALGCLGALVKGWLSPPPNGAAAGAAGAGMVVGALPSTPPSPPSLLVLPPPLLSSFLHFTVEQLGAKGVWGVAMGPAWDPKDAQGAALIGEAVTLHATIALQVALATGGPSPALPLPPTSPPDALACFCTGGDPVTQYGVPPQLAAMYGERLRGCLGTPLEAKEAFIAVASAMRAAASGGRRA